MYAPSSSELLPPDDSFEDYVPAPLARSPLTTIPEPDKLALTNRAASFPERSRGLMPPINRAGSTSGQPSTLQLPPLRPASHTDVIRSQPNAALTTIANLLSVEGRQRQQQQGPISARVSRASSSTSLHPPPSSEPSSLLEALRDELLAEENSSTWGRGDRESPGMSHTRMSQVASAIQVIAEASDVDKGRPSVPQGGQIMHARSRSDQGV